MAFFYPHKTTLFIFLACTVAVAGTAVYVGRARTLANAQNIPVSASAQEKTAPIIASGDWKKAFPALAATTSGSKSKNTAAAAEAETLTDQFGKNFFARYMELQQNNLANNEQAIEQTVNKTIDDLTFVADQPVLYDLKDIKISQKNDDSSRRAYGNAVGTIFYTTAPRADVVAIVSDALEKNELAKLQKLDPVIKSYTSLVQSYLKLSVPEELAQHHVNLINGVSSMLFVTQGLRKISSDPVQGLIALSVYGIAQDALRNSLVGLDEYFIEAHISFSASESGRLFSTIK